MITVLLVVVLIGGLYNILFGLAMHTKNFPSALLFKFLPFLFGLATIIYAIKQFHVV